MQPNTNPSCGNTASGCSNICIGGTPAALDCTTTPGMPACGTWDFESNDVEGWNFDIMSAPDDNAGGAAPFVTVPDPTKGGAASGTHALAIKFTGTGVGGRTLVYVRVHLCPGSSQALNISNRTLTASVKFVPDDGVPFPNTGQGNDVKVWSNTQTGEGAEGADFSVSTADGGNGSGGYFFVNAPLTTDQFGSPVTAATDIGFRFLLNDAWHGTILVDAVRILITR